MEIWKDIKDAPDYEVSNTGVVRHKETKKNPTWYFNTKNGENVGKRIYINKKKRYIHRLVAEAFLDNYENGRSVRHINGNINDNNASNLYIINGKK